MLHNGEYKVCRFDLQHWKTIKVINSKNPLTMLSTILIQVTLNAETMKDFCFCSLLEITTEHCECSGLLMLAPSQGGNTQILDSVSKQQYHLFWNWKWVSSTLISECIISKMCQITVADWCIDRYGIIILLIHVYIYLPPPLVVKCNIPPETRPRHSMYRGLRLEYQTTPLHKAVWRMNSDEVMYRNSHSDLIHLVRKRPGVGEEQTYEGKGYMKFFSVNVWWNRLWDGLISSPPEKLLNRTHSPTGALGERPLPVAITAGTSFKLL